MSEETGTQNIFNSVLEKTVSFLGIHKWEPDIYIWLSLALHLQCATDVKVGERPLFMILWPIVYTVNNEDLGVCLHPDWFMESAAHSNDLLLLHT